MPAANATLVKAVTLLHRANLGEEPEPVELDAGAKLTVLKDFGERVLCKNATGQLFNVPKEWLQPG